MNRLLHIAKDSFRYWSHRPLLAITGTALLAVGTAAVSVLWIITDTVARKPLPFPEPERLWGLQSLELKTGDKLETIAIADFRDFYENAESFESLVAYRGEFLNYENEAGETTQIFASRVTEGFEEVFQVKPLLGSLFASEQFHFGNENVALISQDFWSIHLGNDPDVIGKSIRFDKNMYQIIGVLPSTYKEPAFAEVWMPFPNGSPEYFVRDSRYWNGVGRLRSDVSSEQAEAELRRIAQSLEEDFPRSNRNRSVLIVPLQEILVGDIQTPLYLMLGSIALVMFATCFNLANLQMMSGLQRRQEMSARLALGEPNHLLVMRSMGEAFFLSLVGCGLGWAIASFTIERIDRILPPFFLPRIHELTSGQPMAGVIVLIVIVTGIIFGGIPASHALRASVFQSLKSGQTRHSLSTREKRMRNALLALQIGVSVLILHVALVMIHAFRDMKSLELGFRETNLMAVAISPSQDNIGEFRKLSAYYQGVQDWISRQAGVAEVTSASSPPLWGFDFEMSFELRGRDLVAERDMPATVLYNSVSTNYFDTMGVALSSGRTLNHFDSADSARVVVVNQAFVESYLDGQDPLEQELKIMPWMENGFRRVVGVVENLKQGSLTEQVKPEVFAPVTQTPWIFTSILVRTHGSPEKFTEKLKLGFSTQYPDLGVTFVGMDELLEGQLARTEMMYILFSAFSVIVTILSVFGMGSQVAFDTADRMPEWGIRLSLGSSAAALRKHIVMQLLEPVSMGALGGFLATIALYRFTPQLSIDIEGWHIVASLSVMLGLFLASISVAWRFSFRITSLHPSAVLKTI